MAVIFQYEKIKDYILTGLEEGTWQAGDKIPSEAELVMSLNVSRMTVNRAVRELANSGLLVRIPGAGTFVATERKAAQLLEVRSISDQIKENNQVYKATVLKLAIVKAIDNVLEEFEDTTIKSLYHSIILHHADDIPVQLEDRFVNPAIDKTYLDIDFTKTTPNEHLMQIAPLAEVEHIIEAIMPTKRERKILQIDEGTPCLLLTRRTWSGGHVATYVRLKYPSKRFRFGTRFSYRGRKSVHRAAFS
ncbi:MAG: histidine utilization repressor [Rhodospirillaceae bacterium]|nr:histidine utilization repressor [Rhodospirillaceae bacterium]MBT7276900.1 histidine utilization repressor [Woeseiaceae bacterium]